MNPRWIATCPHETVGVLDAELDALGVRKRTTLHRGVAFEADLETAYRAHLSLRTASRIQRVVKEFQVSEFREFQGALKTIVWADWLRSFKPFAVDAVLTDAGAQAMGEQAVVGAVAASIAESPFEKSPPKFDPEAEDPITLVAFVRNGTCTLGIDTAGRALHKRGWRLTGHPAVLKETLAASILMLAGYTGDEILLDPMCGSGTLVIEAAYIALHKAPLIHRGKDDFALEHLAGFDRPLWRRVSDQLRAARKDALRQPIYASDLEAKYVEVARASALRARVERYLEFSVKPFQQWTAPAPAGLVVANLPYGERIGGSVEALYRAVSRTLKERFSGWRAALLVPAAAPSSLFGMRLEKEIAMMNGALPVKLLVGRV
jgi:23S rRNA G2445 N2-methylase RlmL